MKSGAAFSAIFLIWIIGIVFAFYLFIPDISRSLRTINSIKVSIENDTTQLGIADSESLIDYSPLSIFDN